MTSRERELEAENAELRSQIALLTASLSERDEAIDALQRLIFDWKTTALRFRQAALSGGAVGPAAVSIPAAVPVEFTHPDPASFKKLASTLKGLASLPPGMHNGFMVLEKSETIKLRFFHWVVEVNRAGSRTMVIMHASHARKSCNAVLFNTGNNGWYNWSPGRAKTKQFMSGSGSVGTAGDKPHNPALTDGWGATCALRDELSAAGSAVISDLPPLSPGLKGHVFTWTSMVVAFLAENNMIVVTNPGDVCAGSVWVFQPNSTGDAYYCPGTSDSVMHMQSL